MTALFAALACVATMSIRIPTPGTGGYIHPGDAIVILAGIILGPVYGMLAGGIGSALSDLIGGYFCICSDHTGDQRTCRTGIRTDLPEDVPLR